MKRALSAVLMLALDVSVTVRQSMRYLKRNRAPADMIFAGLLAVFCICLLMFGMDRCGHSDYGNLERILAIAPR